MTVSFGTFPGLTVNFFAYQYERKDSEIHMVHYSIGSDEKIKTFFQGGYGRNRLFITGAVMKTVFPKRLLRLLHIL